MWYVSFTWKKYAFAIIGCVLVPLLSFAAATSTVQKNEIVTALQQQSYEITLQYSDKYKTVIPNDTFQYKILNKVFIPSVLPDKADIIGVLVDEHGVELTRFGINVPRKARVPKNGSIIFSTGAPLVPHTSRIDIYVRGELATFIPISTSGACVANGVCESFAGETAASCPTDCFDHVPAFSGDVATGSPTHSPAFEIPNYPTDPSELGAFGATGTPAASSTTSAIFPLSRAALATILFVFSLVTFFIWMVLRARAKALE